MKSVKNWVGLSWIVFFTACPLFGQVKKLEKLTEEGYAQWSQLYDLQISPRGGWVSFKLHYLTQPDTIVIQNTSTSSKIVIPDAGEGVFGGERWFGSSTENSGFELVDLVTGTKIKEDNIEIFYFSDEGHLLYLYSRNAEGVPFIKIRNLSTAKVTVLEGVLSSSLAPDKSQIAWTTSIGDAHEVLFLDLKSNHKPIILAHNTTRAFKGLAWDSGGKSVVFYSQTKGQEAAPVLYRYEVEQKKTTQMVLEGPWKLPDGMTIADAAMQASDDRTKVFFRLKQQVEKDSTAGTAQIWHAADRNLFAKRRTNDLQKRDRLGVWFTDTGAFQLLGQEDHYLMLLSGTQDHLITYDTAPYEPSWKYEPDRDCYITEVATGKTKALQFLASEVRNIHASGDGKYLFYFKNDGWWRYHIKDDTHLPLTKDIKVAFDDGSINRPEIHNSYGIAGLTTEGTGLLVYDQYDIWELDLHGKDPKRLTNGREQGITFRIVKDYKKHKEATEFSAVLPTIDVQNKILISATSKDNGTTGYYSLNKKGKNRKILFQDQFIYSLRKASETDAIVYFAEAADTPTELHFTNDPEKQPNVLFQSNPQHHKYMWGKCERVVFKNPQGIEMDGYLYYPSDFDPSKKYPMVVQIYETMRQSYRRYIAPSRKSMDGFNKSDYQHNGYFVFFPNIKYEIGNVGHSAVKCVEDAVAAVVQHYPIDSEKIGLYGHSFGGYEAFFLATQSKTFAAIAAGAGIADLTSFYLSLGQNNRVPDFYRFEHHQWRLEKTLFEDPKRYRDNSPITYAEQVTTPVLSWTGAEDKQLNPFQSMEFYMAMRRLGKQHVMLVYPKEDHVILNLENQKDVGDKIMHWFDHYLKGEILPKWAEAR